MALDHVYLELDRRSPKIRVVSGAVCVLGGAALTIIYWNKGFIWALPLIVLILGSSLFMSGVLGLKSEAKRRACIEFVQKNKIMLLQGMIEAKRKNQNLVKWLSDQGVADFEVRTQLLEAVRQYLRSAAGGDQRHLPA